ncbi:MAG TPA: TetR/AcrR family transcriptional regulator [Steroidobacteraceae bacterium]|nr:TetR/AcrR family transcriptional regulator [Steroidobacteraceae bacterium]
MLSARKRRWSTRRPTLGDSETAQRKYLVEVAEDVFLECGYHRATMDDIARRAGMSKKTLYVLFQGKAALFEALLTERFEPFSTPIPDEGRPMAESLCDFLTGIARLVLSPRQLALTRLMIAESPRSPQVVAALQRQTVCKGEGALETWLGRQAAQGRLSLSDSREAAAMLFGMSVGQLLLEQLVQAHEPPSEADVERRIERAVQVFLAGQETLQRQHRVRA